MAEQPGYDPHAVGEMDYKEHDRTYAGFLGLVKYGSIAVIAILVFMLVTLVAGGGLIAGVVSAGVFAAAAIFVLGTGESHSMKH